jgi:amino acid permease
MVPSRASNFQRFTYAVLAADQIVAVSNTVKFHYDDGRTFLSWVVGENVNAAVWISLFLIIVTVINMFPVKVSSPRKFSSIKTVAMGSPF